MGKFVEYSYISFGIDLVLYLQKAVFLEFSQVRAVLYVQEKCS